MGVLELYRDGELPAKPEHALRARCHGAIGGAERDVLLRHSGRMPAARVLRLVLRAQFAAVATRLLFHAHRQGAQRGHWRAHADVS